MIISYYDPMLKSSRATTHRRGPGRPREFDMEAAVDGALLVFRERGYHAASLGDLGSAMKLTAGSIYKAFSDKRAIFLAAFDRYIHLRNTQLRQLLDAQRNGFDKLRAMFRFYAEASSDIEGRRGCLVVGTLTELATFDAETAARVTTFLRRAETLLRELVRLGQSDGSIPSGINADATARALLCLLQGLRVIGKAGRTRTEMMAVVDQALRLLA
jgi:TetR/AcrR family transcriptional regulator, transcriptional repressor for nem operon